MDFDNSIDTSISCFAYPAQPDTRRLIWMVHYTTKSRRHSMKSECGTNDRVTKVVTQKQIYNFNLNSCICFSLYKCPSYHCMSFPLIYSDKQSFLSSCLLKMIKHSIFYIFLQLHNFYVINIDRFVFIVHSHETPVIFKYFHVPENLPWFLNSYIIHLDFCL